METIEKYFRQRNVDTLVDMSSEKKKEGVKKILKGAARFVLVGAAVALTFSHLGFWSFVAGATAVLAGPGQVRKGVKEMTTDAEKNFKESKELKGIAQDDRKILSRDIAESNEANATKESLKSKEPLKMAEPTEISIVPERTRETTNTYVS